MGVSVFVAMCGLKYTPNKLQRAPLATVCHCMMVAANLQNVRLPALLSEQSNDESQVSRLIFETDIRVFAKFLGVAVRSRATEVVWM